MRSRKNRTVPHNALYKNVADFRRNLPKAKPNAQPPQPPPKENP